jgi:hypothetical protein
MFVGLVRGGGVPKRLLVRAVHLLAEIREGRLTSSGSNSLGKESSLA